MAAIAEAREYAVIASRAKYPWKDALLHSRAPLSEREQGDSGESITHPFAVVGGSYAACYEWITGGHLDACPACLGLPHVEGRYQPEAAFRAIDKCYKELHDKALTPSYFDALPIGKLDYHFRSHYTSCFDASLGEVGNRSASCA